METKLAIHDLLFTTLTICQKERHPPHPAALAQMKEKARHIVDTLTWNEMMGAYNAVGQLVYL